MPAARSYRPSQPTFNLCHITESRMAEWIPCMFQLPTVCRARTSRPWYDGSLPLSATQVIHGCLLPMKSDDQGFSVARCGFCVSKSLRRCPTVELSSRESLHRRWSQQCVISLPCFGRRRPACDLPSDACIWVEAPGSLFQRRFSSPALSKPFIFWTILVASGREPHIADPENNFMMPQMEQA